MPIAESIDSLAQKIQILVEQNELLRRHNTFLLEENATVSQEFTQFRRQITEREQELSDALEAARKAEQERQTISDAQFQQLKQHLRQLDNNIDDWFYNRKK